MNDKSGSDYYFYRGRRLFFCIITNRLVFYESESDCRENRKEQGHIELSTITSISNDSLSIKLFDIQNKKYELLSTRSDSVFNLSKQLRKMIVTNPFADVKPKPSQVKLDRIRSTKELEQSIKEEIHNTSVLNKEEKCNKKTLEKEQNNNNNKKPLMYFRKTLERRVENQKKKIDLLERTVESQKDLILQMKNIIVEKLGMDALKEITSQDIDLKLIDPHLELGLHETKINKIDFEEIKVSIDDEFLKTGIIGQITRDTIVWEKTFKSINKKLKGILIRILCTIKFGGLLYRCRDKDEWNDWYDTGWPCVSALSHGGRVIIQIPKASEDESDVHSFWKWLITGKEKGYLYDVLSTKTSGSEASKEKKLMFKRIGSTHAMAVFDEKTPNIGKKINVFQKNGEYFDFLIKGGRQKVVYEQKVLGISFRDTKNIIMNDGKSLLLHRNWGMNIPLGGENNRGLDGRLIKSDGSNGHVYLYYLHPTKDRYGGIMVGIEGSEYGKTDTTGNYHGLRAKSNVYSPTYGYKWFSKTEKNLLKFNVPDKYNGMLVDLTLTGWKFLKKKEKNWQDSMVFTTSEQLKEIKRDKEEISLKVAELKQNVENKNTPQVFLNKISRKFYGKRQNSPLEKNSDQNEKQNI